jgi:predicted patatin/cPLA2 family phospholipase
MWNRAGEDLGFGWRRNAFDAVYGSSAGAINLTYFLSDQQEGVQIYSEDIANKKFCDLLRLMNSDQGANTDQCFSHGVLKTVDSEQGARSFQRFSCGASMVRDQGASTVQRGVCEHR